MQLKPSKTPLAGRGRFCQSFLYMDLPMTVGMQQLQVVGCARAASAAPDAMVDMHVFLRDSQRLTADQASSLSFLPQAFDPTATCQRLAQLPYQSCFQVQFPLRIVELGRSGIATPAACYLDVYNGLP
jgi:hypothetical protein